MFFFQMKNTSKDIQDIPDSKAYINDMVVGTPPLLFAAYTHMDILGLGACPWAYIRAVSDCLLQVRATNPVNISSSLVPRKGSS